MQRYASGGRASYREVDVTLVVVIIVVLLAVLGFGYLIFRMMRRSQETVPQITDRDDANDLVVGTDEQGRSIRASEEVLEPVRDETGFESLLKDEIHDLGHEEPRADDG